MGQGQGEGRRLFDLAFESVSWPVGGDCVGLGGLWVAVGADHEGREGAEEGWDG